MALGLLAFAPDPAGAAPLPAGLLGTWSQSEACDPLDLRVVFTAGEMEVRQDGERRSLTAMQATRTRAGEVELRTIRVMFVRQPNAAPPTAGDILRFRLDGDLLRVLAVTTQGKLVTLPADSTVFHRCHPP